jgi:hypothetical protein
MAFRHLLQACAKARHRRLLYCGLSRRPQFGGFAYARTIGQQVSPSVVDISVLSRAPMEENPLFRDPFFRRFCFFDHPQAPARPSAAWVRVSSWTLPRAAYLPATTSSEMRSRSW